MDLAKLNSFYKSALAKSISKAKIPLSSSVISRHISDLESELGVSLFIRNPKGLELTSHGNILLDQCEKIFKEINITLQLLAKEKENPTDSLTVHLPTSWASTILVGYLSEFLKQFPKIRLTIVSDDEEPNFFETNQLIAILPYSPKDPRLVRKLITHFHLGLYAHKDYLKTHGTPNKIEDLDNHLLIGSTNRNPHFKELDWHLSLGAEEPRIPHLRLDNHFLAADCKLGIASLAKENIYLLKSSLVEVLPEVRGPALSAYLVYPEMIRNLKPVILFSKFIIDIIEKN